MVRSLARARSFVVRSIKCRCGSVRSKYFKIVGSDDSTG